MFQVITSSFQYTELRIGGCRIGVNEGICFIIPLNHRILHPFNRIAGHVVKFECIRLFFTHGMYLVVGIVLVPGHFVHIVASAEGVGFQIVAAPCGKFPFTLRRQTEGFAGKSVQFVNKGDAVIPGNVVDWQVGPLEYAWVCLPRPSQLPTNPV